MRILLVTVLSLFIFSSYPNEAQAQFKKLKDKMKKAGKKVLGTDKKEESSNTQTGNNSDGTNTNQGGKVQGKKLAPPDVDENLDNASAALKNQRYSDMRLAIKQAMRGIEIKQGLEILDNSPKSVAGANYIEAEDQVVSTGIGFAGLMIGRQYEGNNKKIRMQIANNSALLANYNAILTNGNYASSDGEYKTTMVQGFRAAIRFDGDNTYSLGVPLGQSTIFVLDMDNVADEAEVKSIAGNFNLQQIKDILGEQ